MFPGYHYNRSFMESMMGVKQSLFLDDEPPRISAVQKYFVEFPSLIRLLARSGLNFIRIQKIVDDFETHFYKHYDAWTKIDFDSIPPHEIMRLHDMMEEKMLWNWKAPIINDFYVMVFYGTLRKLCRDWCGDASLQNGLICGEGGLQSDEPAKLLIRMTGVVRENDALKSLIIEQPAETLPELIGGDSRFSEFNQLMTIYLHEFGLRCANELKLESFSYQDEPHRLFEIIRSYLHASDSSHHDLAAINRREKNIRQLAEQQADEMLAKSRNWFPRRWLFQFVLNNARNGVKNRENMRFARTRIYGVLRRMLRSIGGHFEAFKILDDREDIFYLTIDEVWDFVKGTAVSTNLRELSKLRKREFDVYRLNASSPESRFETFGMAYHDNVYRSRDVMKASVDGELLSGIGCCPGSVAGRTQVVRDPSVDTYFKGNILVAERTDPGWVPFFPAFSGILVERGSVLSHSAIVAREMGIPTIVGIRGLTQRVHTGDAVKMDGQTGIVEITSSI
jgi:pyruvate,water dikinase